MLPHETNSLAEVSGKLGEVLVSQGEITEEQLAEANERAANGDQNLGHSLVSLGYLGAEQLARTYARLLNLEYVELSEKDFDPGVVGLIAGDVLVRHGALPVRAESGRLIVAISDPSDVDARSDLIVSAGQPITPAVANADIIRALQEKYLVRANGSVHEPAVHPENGTANGAGNRDSRNDSENRVANAGSASQRTPRVGEILVSEGRLTSGQLEEALALQRNDARDLGEILISLGYVNAEDLARALARRFRLDYVRLSELSESDVDPEALNLIDETTLRKYMALPLRFEDGKLIVAMSNPNDLFALEDLRIIARHPIAPVVATQEDLEGALSHLFGGENGAEPQVNETSGYVEPEQPAHVESVAETPVEYRHNEIEIVPAPAAPVEDRRRQTGGVATKMGDILIAMGKITDEQLQEALALQRQDRREIGKILLSLGYISKLDLAQALATRLRLDYMELVESDVDRAVIGLVDQKIVRRHGVMPVRMEAGRLVVAMSDPTNIYALEDLMMISGFPITPVVALEDQITRVQNKLYAVGAEVTELLKDAAGESGLDDFGEVELGADSGADDAPIVRLVGSILQQAVGEGASDIHVEPRSRELTVRFRVDGVLREVMSIPPKLQSGVIARLKILANLDIAERRIPQDGRFSVRLGGQRIDIRAASLPTVFGEKTVLRLLDNSNVEADLRSLGFAPEVFETYEQIFNRPYGAILVTGPTGSGKSTTLYATLAELNSPERNIITVEDPVEFRMEGINQVQVNVKAGLTFASGLRSILRSDPDVVMIGEIRDYETAKISVEAALTGHLILATLHTNNAPAAVNRMTEMGVEPFLTSSAVDCVIAQRLARRLCDNCKQPLEIGKDVLADIGFPFERFSEDISFYRPVGCNRCGGSGYRGRVGIYEMMVVTSEIKDMVLRRVSTDEISRAAEEHGMVRLKEDGLMKAARGMTTIEEILRTVV